MIREPTPGARDFFSASLDRRFQRVPGISARAWGLRLPLFGLLSALVISIAAASHRKLVMIDPRISVHPGSFAVGYPLRPQCPPPARGQAHLLLK